MSEHEEYPVEFRGEQRNVDQSGAFLLILIVIALLVAGIWGIALFSWRPKANMERQPYYRPYEPSQIFVDGMSERPLSSGVVPRPKDQSPGIPYVAVRTPGPAHYPVLAKTTTAPIAITQQVIERGQEMFNIYCSVCHGATGDGRGMIVQRGFYPPPSFHIDRLRKAPDSHFFDVITNGYGTMFDYSDRVAPEDRWKIIAYIRALQMGVEKHEPQIQRNMQKPAGVRP